jgi:hypothetical protein
VEIVVQILKHLPSGWPRIIVLLGLALLFFFPEMRRLLTKGHRDKERFGQAKQLLELRKLELTVVDLKFKYPEAQNVSLDLQIEELLCEPQSNPQEIKSFDWKDRLKFSLAGSFALMVMGSIAIWHSGKLVDGELGKFILTELGLTVICGFLASVIPCYYRWECVFRGFLIPALLGALAVAAKGNM